MTHAINCTSWLGRVLQSFFPGKKISKTMASTLAYTEKMWPSTYIVLNRVGRQKNVVNMLTAQVESI